MVINDSATWIYITSRGRSVSARMEGSSCGSEWVLRVLSAISSGWLNSLAQKVCAGYRTTAPTRTTVTDVWQPDLQELADSANDFKYNYSPVSHLKGQNTTKERLESDCFRMRRPRQDNWRKTLQVTRDLQSSQREQQIWVGTSHWKGKVQLKKKEGARTGAVLCNSFSTPL